MGECSVWGLQNRKKSLFSVSHEENRGQLRWLLSPCASSLRTMCIPMREKTRTDSHELIARGCVASLFVGVPCEKKRGQLRPTRKVQEQTIFRASLRTPLFTLSPCETSSRLLLAGYAMSVTSDTISPKEQGVRGPPGRNLLSASTT